MKSRKDSIEKDYSTLSTGQKDVELPFIISQLDNLAVVESRTASRHDKSRPFSPLPVKTSKESMEKTISNSKNVMTTVRMAEKAAELSGEFEISASNGAAPKYIDMALKTLAPGSLVISPLDFSNEGDSPSIYDQHQLLASKFAVNNWPNNRDLAH